MRAFYLAVVNRLFLLVFPLSLRKGWDTYRGWEMFDKP